MSFFLTIITTLFAFSFSQPIVDTPLGQVIGSYTDVDDTPVAQYIGIPYATPPVGELRFRPSTVIESFPSDPYQAFFPRACIQLSDTLSSIETEDCLVLNIYTPENTTPDSNLPVLIFVHGGSGVNGAGIIYSGENFVAKSDNKVILVTINYRLGALGVYASNQLAQEDPDIPANGGLNSFGDVITALRWIKQYISYFGGNSNLITLSGESAGALGITYFMVLPILKNENLFKKLILFSGAGYNTFPIIDKTFAETFTNQFTINAGLSTDIDDLREMDPFLLVTALYGGSDKPFDTLWQASIDGYFIDAPYGDFYFDNIQNINDFNVNEVLITFTTLDTVLDEEDLTGVFESFESYLSNYLSSQEDINAILNTYYPPDNYNNEIEWAQAVNADVCFVCPVYETSNIVSPYIDVYNMQFIGQCDILPVCNNDGEGVDYRNIADNTECERIPHFGDMAYVFDDEGFAQFVGINYDNELSNEYIHLLTDFVTDNKKMRHSYDNLKLYTDKRQKVTLFGNDVKSRNNFWRNYGNNVCQDLWSNIDVTERNMLCYSLPVTP